MDKKDKILKEIEICKKGFRDLEECYKAMSSYRLFKKYFGSYTKLEYCIHNTVVKALDKYLYNEKLDEILNYLDYLTDNYNDISKELANTISEIANDMTCNDIDAKDLPLAYYVDKLDSGQYLIKRFNI